MLSRRELLESACAAAVLGGLPGGAALAASRVRPFAFVVDRNLPAAAEMASRFSGAPAELRVFAGDPGNVWMSFLEPALREKPRVVAGYTSARTLFCLQYLARDFGLELVSQVVGNAPLEPYQAASDLLDLRDPQLGDPGVALTWVLAPKRG